VTILIFGANSGVGKELRAFIKENKCDVIWATSQECNLLSRTEVDSFIKYHNPDTVINLAARVGGMFDNMNRPYDYLYENLMINGNVIDSCRCYGVKKLLSFSSTCAYPDVMPDESYPLSEEDIHAGPPTPTNFSYGYAKRVMQVQTESCNQQYGTQYSYISPCNLYGAYCKFDDTSHYLDRLIRKVWEYNQGKIDKIEMAGGSSAKRQYAWTKDLCEVIKRWIDLPAQALTVNFASPENITIKDITKIVTYACNAIEPVPFGTTIDCIQYVKVKFLNESMCGQANKEISSAKLLSTSGYEDFKFTPLEQGVREVYKEVSKLWQ